MKKSYILIVLSALFISGCATRPPVVVSEPPVKVKKEVVTKVKEKVARPIAVTKPSPDVIMIDHQYFKIAYNFKRRLPEYVTYQLTAEQLRSKSAERKNKFVPDPYLVNKDLPYVVTSEYNRSGYDRGHLAPSADFAWSQDANNMTFVMSNMAPQTPGLNRDAWKRLEDQVRKWACGEEKVTVITGPVLTDNLPTLKSGLEIPQDFFKIVIDETAPKKMIAFLYHQTDKGNVLKERMVPMNNIEKATGIAFTQDFPELQSGKMRVPASLNEWKEADCK
jgi:endonuclease G